MTFYHVYADESRQDAHRYMLYGMIFVPRGTEENALLADLKAFRQSENLTAEMKWTKVSRGKLSAYKRYIDIFFDHPSVEFKCLVVDTHKVDYKQFHDNNRETAFFNFYFYAISRNLQMSDRYIIYPDERVNRETLRWFELRAQVNYYWLQQGAPDAIVRNLQPIDSKLHDPLQLCDLLIGAIGYDLDEYNTSEPRLEFVKHVVERVGCESLRTHWGVAHVSTFGSFVFLTRYQMRRKRFEDSNRNRHPS